METIDVLILSLYLGLILGLGLYFSRRQKSTDDYFLAGRNLPGWVIGFSLMGTVVSSATFVGHPGNTFNSDFWMLALYFAIPLVATQLGHFIIFFRRHIRMSVYEYLGDRFGYPAQAYGSFAYIMARVLDMSMTFYFLAIAVAYLSGWDIWWVILILGWFTLIYTLIGGIGAVVWTDVIQAVLLVGGGLLCIGIVLFGSGLGPQKVISTAWQGGKFGLGNFHFSWFENNIWIFLVGGVFQAFQSFVIGQNAAQRYLLARTYQEARRSALAGVLSCIPIWLIFMFLGACLWSFYQLGTDKIPPDVVAVKDNILPYFIKTQIPHGIMGLMLAALVAAAMSSLDSDLNSVAAVVVQTFHRELWPNADDRSQLMVGRGAVVVFGMAAIWMAQQWIGIESFVEFGVGLASVFSGGMVGLFGLGVLFRRATARGAYAGIAACVLLTAWATLTRIRLPDMENPFLNLGAYNFTWTPVLIGILGNLAVLCVGLVVSLVDWDSKKRLNV